MSIKLKTLSAAVGLVMGTAAINANADALLFPYFQSGNGAYTFLSLSNTVNDDGSLSTGDFTGDTLHYVWNYNDPVQGECTHFDTTGSMSALDLIQQTVVAPNAPGGMDLDASFADASNPAYLFASAPTRGFLTVEDVYQAKTPNGEPLNNEALFFGQAIVVDAVAGTISGYKGLNNLGSLSERNFGTRNDKGDLPNPIGILTSALAHNLTWYPTNDVTTSWFTLVTGSPSATNPDGMAKAAGWNGARNFTAFGANGSVATPGVYNRDEVFFSGSNTVQVTCYGVLERSDLLNQAQQIATDEGGRTFLVNFNPAGGLGQNPTTGATGAILVKIEGTTALGGQRTAISWENAFPNLPY